jgi:hypothetical protein
MMVLVLTFTKVANSTTSSFRVHIVIQTLHANFLDDASLWNLGTKLQ